jgi:hypothetical protein
MLVIIKVCHMSERKGPRGEVWAEGTGGLGRIGQLIGRLRQHGTGVMESL